MNVMRLAPAVLFLALAACTPSTTLAVQEAQPERLHVVILHTNDIHGQVLPRKATWLKKDPAPMVGGIVRAAAYIDRVKSDARKNDEIVFVVDAGDWFQGTPEGQLNAGMSFMNAFGYVGYDAVCVGNHEFDHGIPNLLTILKETKVPAVAANLNVKGKAERVDWVAPWRVVERGGVTIGFVGLVTTITPEITHPDAMTIDFIDAAAAFEAAQKHLKGKVDWIVPLTHLGVETDKALAKAHPGIELIVGGHSHTYLKEGVREGSTLIVQTGSKASAIGRVDVWLDKATKKVLETSSKLIDLEEEPSAAFVSEKPVAIIATNLIKATEERMKERIGEMTATAERTKNPLQSSAMGNFMADAVREYARAEVGLMNRGGIRADLHKGPITRRDVFEVMPFDNSVVVLELTGAELVSFVKNAVEGKAHSGIEVSGITIEVKLEPGDKRTLTGVRVGADPIDPARTYRVAMNSFMADGGDAYLEKVPPGERRTDDMTLLREVLEQLFINKKQVTAATDDRYRVTKP